MLHKNLRGRDLHSPSNELVENNSGSAISALKCVTFTQLGNQYVEIEVAGTSDVVYGVTQSNIPNTSSGYVTCLGFMNSQDTSPWAPGTKLYCNSNGDLSSVIFGLPVAFVLKQDPQNGILYINTQGITQDDIVDALPEDVNAFTIEDFTLSSLNISQKKIILSNTPKSSESLRFQPDGGLDQRLGIDYSVFGNEISWDGLELDGFLEVGEKIRIIYKS